MEANSVMALVGGGIALVSPALLWLVKENASLKKRLEDEQANRVSDLKLQQAETRSLLTEVHEMVTALRRYTPTDAPQSQSGKH